MPARYSGPAAAASRPRSRGSRRRVRRAYRSPRPTPPPAIGLSHRPYYPHLISALASRDSEPPNARHHPPPRKIVLQEILSVGGRVHAVVRRCPLKFMGKDRNLAHNKGGFQPNKVFRHNALSVPSSNLPTFLVL